VLAPSGDGPGGLMTLIFLRTTFLNPPLCDVSIIGDLSHDVLFR